VSLRTTLSAAALSLPDAAPLADEELALSEDPSRLMP
jgi:hypothetical protein